MNVNTWIIWTYVNTDVANTFKVPFLKRTTQKYNIAVARQKRQEKQIKKKSVYNTLNHVPIVYVMDYQ